jgi:hypothetical protein
MNAPLRPEVVIGMVENGQTRFPLASEGVMRYIWESRFGSILIEVRDAKIFVNGGHVELASSQDDAPA